MKQKCKCKRPGSSLDPNEIRIIQGSKQELWGVNPDRYKTLLYISSPISRTSDFYIDEKYVEKLGSEEFLFVTIM